MVSKSYGKRPRFWVVFYNGEYEKFSLSAIACKSAVETTSIKRAAKEINDFLGCEAATAGYYDPQPNNEICTAINFDTYRVL